MNTKKGLLLICGALLVFCAFVGTSTAKTWYVDDDGGADFTNIQDAIDNASAGDTIVVRSGNYEGNIVLNKTLLLIGEEEAWISVSTLNGGKFGIKITADECTVVGFDFINWFGHNRGMLIESNNNRILNNSFSNFDDAVILKNSSSNTILENFFDGLVPVDYHIYLYNSSNNTISNNEFLSDYGTSIYLIYSSGNIISDNKIYEYSADGIHLKYSFNNTISNNEINPKAGEFGFLLGTCVFLEHSIDNIISNNHCYFHFFGIDLYKSRSNLILNNICENAHAGISLNQSSSNQIYLNDFVDNWDSYWSISSDNIWNSTSPITYTYNGSEFENYLGNYWDDYTGTDADGDGIGDTPYSIDSDKDNYPLMEQWENYFLPTISISTDKFKYFPGDIMTITFDIANPTEDSVTFQWYWGVPRYRIWIPVKSASIPAGYNDTHNFSFIIPNLGLTPFGNVFYVQLLDADGKVLDADIAWWAYSTRGKAMPVDVEEEIMKTIETME